MTKHRPGAAGRLPTASVLPATGARRRHRRRIFAALRDFCRGLERLQIDPEAREACREVARWIAAEHGREPAAARRRRRP